MIKRSEIIEWVESFLEGSDRFVVDVLIKNNDHIAVFLDSDTALTIEHCIEVSRMLESKLDRDVEDFDLKVSSAGLDHPLVMQRQYVKNIGRKIKFDLKDGSTQIGKLLEVHQKYVLVELINEQKKNKIKQTTSGETLEFPFADIERAMVQVSFG